MMKKNVHLVYSRILGISAALLLTICLVSPLTIAYAAEQEKTENAESSKIQKQASSQEESVAEEETQPFRVYLRSNQNFYYEGDPIEIEITLANDSSEVLKNPVKLPFAKSFILEDEDGNLFKPQSPKDAPEEVQPSPMVPKFYYGMLLDVTKHFPSLSKRGRYKIKWRSGDIESDELNINVIQKYDLEKEYYAIMDTDLGQFRLDFFKEKAPLAVKAFIDLANGGFYEGQIFYQVKPGDYVLAGDPKGDGTGTSGLLIPAEFNDIPVVTGTVLMTQHLGAPPRNDGKFLISLRARPEKTGFLTVFAQVSDGLEIVKKISAVPSTEDAHKPFYKPLKDLIIKKITVFEKGEK